jgi:hypothetical protein
MATFAVHYTYVVEADDEFEAPGKVVEYFAEVGVSNALYSPDYVELLEENKNV